MKRVLSATAVANAKPKATEYKLTDGGGLYLRVWPTGTKAWRYKYRLHDKQRDYTIGAYPEISLQKARELHAHARQLVTAGEHPLQVRRRQEKSTFESIAREWMGLKRENWSARYAAQVRRTLESDVFPRIGGAPIAAISALDILDVVQSVADRRVPPGKLKERARGASTVALLIRQICSSIFCYAVARKLAERDVAADLKGAIVRPKVRHHPGLALADIAPLLNKLREYRDRSAFISPTTVIAIELLLLTFVRTSELRQARWGEIDFERELWVIPAERMKMRHEHLVPLSPRALELLHDLQRLQLSRDWLFPNRRRPDACMGATTINRALEYMGYGGQLSGHGFRATASTLLHEHGVAPAHIEKQLAHEQRNRVAAAYNKAEYISQRREMMNFWANLVHGVPSASADVIPIALAARASHR